MYTARYPRVRALSLVQGECTTAVQAGGEEGAGREKERERERVVHYNKQNLTQGVRKKFYSFFGNPYYISRKSIENP